MENALITLRHVEKDYDSGAGTVRALREVDLAINQGEFVAIVGTSGSGKSTLMNILGCLLPRTTALENVELPLVYRGVSARERRKLANAALEAVGLGDRVHHTPNQLSGGQQQRVAIARALVTSPPMLLADEPTGNLDTRTSLEVLALLQALNRDRGITIVLVTHEHDIAACASRVVTFRDGRIVTDVVQDKPLDAAGELSELPPPEASTAAAEDAHDPALAARRLGGPVPKLLYVAMAAAGIGGIILGTLYAKLILDTPAGVLPLIFGFVFEAFVAAWYGRRRFGRPLTSDQRVRIAITYTLVGAGLVAPLFALGWMPGAKGLLDRLDPLSSGGVLAAIGVTLLGLGTIALARYLLLALVSPIVDSTKAKGAGRSQGGHA